MRIAIVTTSWGAPWSEGVRNLARRLRSDLCAHGHQVSVIHPPLAASGETPRNDAAWRYVRAGMHFVSRARAELRVGQFNAAVWFTSLSSWYGLKFEMLRSAGVPVVPFVTGLRRVVSGYRWPASRGRPTAVISPYFRERYFPHARLVTPFLPLAVSRPAGFRRPAAGVQRRILFLGSLEAERGVECLLAALARLDASYHLTLAWNGVGARRRPVVDAAVARQELQSRVTWRREVDVASACCESDVLVIPRASRTKMAFPVRILEAAHMRLPLVVSDVLGFGSLIGSAGRSFPAGSAAGLARAIEQLTSDDAAYARAVAGCETLDERYDSTIALHSMRKVIDDVAA